MGDYMKKRKDGRYRRQIYIGKKDTGKLDKDGRPIMKPEYMYVYGYTKPEVDKAYADAKSKMGKGIDIKAANDTFAVWAERYVAHKESSGLSAAYLVQIKNERQHLAALDGIPLSKITIADVQDIIDGRSVWHDGKPPLSKRSLRGIKNTARQIFKSAIASRVVEYNPADFVTIPANAAQKTREALTETQQEWVKTVEHRARRAAMIMMFAGLRRGELLALTWADIDLKKKTITVKKAVAFEDGKPKNKNSTKTEAGMRVVNIPMVLVKYLREEKKKDNCLFVVHTNSGRQLTQSGWRRLWESYMAEINVQVGYKDKENVTSRMHPEKLVMRIETFTPHQLRHTFCTLMYLAGVDILTARDQMGHEDIETTLQIYTHLDSKYKRNSMGKLDKYLDGQLTVKRKNNRRANG